MAAVDTDFAGDHALQSNGDHAEVPDFEAVGDFEPQAEAETNGVDLDETEPDEGPSNKLYFVRVPRPPVSDDLVKKLQLQFQEHVNKIKGLNAKLGAKRDEMREFRRQLNEARALKDTSKPEYEDRLQQLQGLRDARNTYSKQIQDIKGGLRGLECKSEEELEAKIRELEGRISHDGLTLREEKQVVQQISKLQSQRGQIRDVGNQKSSLTQLEEEYSKVRAIIGELEGDFTLLKAERDSTHKVMKDKLDKLKAVEQDFKELEEEQSEAVKAKNDVLANLDKARSEMNDAMGDYRDNRSFSLKIRDMVTAGQVEEARALCAEQVDEWVSKLSSNKAFRNEYHTLWAQQRRYAVSELLPQSTTTVQEPREVFNGKGAGGRPAPGKLMRKEAPKPQGAEKAKALIEMLMAEASAEASRAPRPADAGDEEEDVDDAEPAAAPAPVVPEFVKPHKPSKAAEPIKVEVPVIPDEAFVLPTQIRSQTVAAVDKDKVREEQLAKSTDAEKRKKKQAELREKKKKEAEAKAKLDALKKKEEAAAAALQKAKAAQEEPKALVTEPEEEVAAPVAQKEIATSSKAVPLKPAFIPIAKSQVTVAAKRPKGVEPIGSKIKRWLKQYGVAIASILVLLICIVLAVYASS